MSDTEPKPEESSQPAEQPKPTGPEIVNPAGPEGLKKMQETMPTSPSGGAPSGGGGGTIELEEKTANIYSVVGPVIGIGNRDYLKSRWGDGDIYSVIERTDLEPVENSIMCRLAQRAEHGLGGQALDRPMQKVGERLVMELRARRSKFRGSSIEFENIMTAYQRKLRQEEFELEKANAKMLGVGS